MTLRSAARPLSLTRCIPSTLKAVEALALEVRGLLLAHGLQAASFGVELALRECLNNAVLHGNRRNARKRVILDLSCGRKWICLRTKDEGAGFDWRAKRRAPEPDVEAPSGRGLRILRAYAKRIQFNRCGNQITLWLLRDSRKTTLHPISKPTPKAARRSRTSIRN